MRFAPSDYIDPPPPCAIEGCSRSANKTIATLTTADGGRHRAVITLYVCSQHLKRGQVMVERDFSSPDAHERLGRSHYHISIEGTR